MQVELADDADFTEACIRKQIENDALDNGSNEHGITASRVARS